MAPTALAIDGGTPIRTAPWPSFERGDLPMDSIEVDAVSRVVKKRLLFRYDRRPMDETEVGSFERKIEAYFGQRHALAVSSGTAAIALALIGAGLEPGAEVLCQGFGFPATVSAVLLAGGVPVLVEVDENLNLDIDDVRRKIGPRTGAIVVVHMRGFASDVDALLELAEPADIVVVEDAVPALGARLRGRLLGTIGHAGAFSTQSGKSLNSGEGGFLITDDSTLFARATLASGAYEGRLRRHFPDSEPPIEDLTVPVYNFRMDEVRGALASAQLDRLPDRLTTLTSNYTHIVTELADIGEVRIRQPIEPGALLGEAVIVRIPDSTPDFVAWFAAAMRAEGVSARAFGDPDDLNVRAYWTWRFLFPGRDRDWMRSLLPATTRYLDQSIDIPLAPTVGAQERSDLIESVHKVADHARANGMFPQAVAAP